MDKNELAAIRLCLNYGLGNLPKVGRVGKLSAILSEGY